MSGRFCDVVEDSTPPDFECVVLDADLPIFQVKKLEGVLAYVRVLSGKLPALMRNVLVDTWGNLLGRPEKGAFMPSAANLVIPAGRSYPVTLLASLPPLATLRPYLRNALLPAHDLDPAALPVALGGLPQDFRAVAGRLVSAPRSTPVEVDPMALWEAGQKAQEAGLHRAIALGDVVANNKPSLAVEHILTALTDEIEDVRFAAAYRLRSVLDEVPVTAFLDTVRDTRPVNYAACLAAAYVFAAHPDEVSPQTLLDLYYGIDHRVGRNASRAVYRPIIQAVVVRAMGRLGARAPNSIIELLAGILREQRAFYDIRVRAAAASALGDLGALAPVDALIAGTQIPQPEIAARAARALAQHPGDVPQEMRERAHLFSDVEEARRIIYRRWYAST